MRLKNKVIIITGSCTGIGKAIALRAVEEGAKVVVHGLEKEWGEEVVATLGKGNAILHIEDITNEGAAERLVQLAVKTFGKLDSVVNNAAIVASSNLHTTDATLLRKVIEVNTVAPFVLIKAALPHLKKQKGSVLNIGSVNAYSGEPNLFAYSVSKGALMTLTHNLGDTLFREEGVRVNQINPGWVLTENETIRKKQHGLAEDWYKDLPTVYAPARRIIWPAEIAAAAVYFLSDESGPVSGQVLTIEQYPSNSRNPPKDTSTIHK
ncbi:short-chain dehydrogenase [Terrimonas sp.]|uniref:SDR family NAD(P)-dependent oxidoreductase n=1 Tax=Terrimonas sp. TaxID=1914338 RepID=UPI000D5158F9|nr:SDR family oxidoreductase [Terrimonas sp.]PVD52775.1 short-chain dehydrogenase [Terrimonas sp.]